MNSISAGLSALQAGQKGLDIVGQNIANASTKGYHKQVLNLVTRTSDGRTGSGVEVAGTIRYTADSVRTAILKSTSEGGRIQSRLATQRQAETLFETGPSSVGGMLESFFNQMEQLTSRPEDLTQRRLALSNVDNMAKQLNSLSGELNRLRGDVGREISNTVEQVNAFASRIAELNVHIAKVEIQGDPANELRDQRGRVLSDLSELIDVRIIPQDFGKINVISADTSLVVSDTTTKFKVNSDANQNLFISAEPDTTPLPIKDGRLKGLLDDYNAQLPEYLDQLNTLADSLIRNLDSIQATGIGSSGLLTNVTGVRAVNNPTVPLAVAGLSIPPQIGELRISVTNQATGNRVQNVINIDPNTQSLQDLANAITTGTSGQVQASIDPVSNQLQLQAQSGFTFDFAGRVPSPVPSVNMNGSAVPTVSGVYTGANNDTFNFQVVGSGTIGSTPGLSLEVRNGSGALIQTLNIGQGYAPDSVLKVTDGITVKLSAGTTTNGTFSTPVTSQPDTSGILTSLGVNSLFQGDSAFNIAVRPELLNDPTKLSISRNGEIGDSSNALRFGTARDAKVLSSDTQSFSQFLNDVVGSVGSEVQTLNDQDTATNSLLRNLTAQEQSVVGVDMNEELVNLLQYQRMVDAGSRFLSVVNTAMDAILNIVR